MKEHDQNQEKEIGLFPVMLFLVSFLGGVVTILGAINIAFDLEASATFRGVSAELPNDEYAVMLMAIFFSLCFAVYKLLTRSKAKK